MKRRCPYCGYRYKGKELSSHIYEVHHGGGREFYCRDSCVRCCTDSGAPLELLLSDIERIAGELCITTEDLFTRYGGVLWTNIPGTTALIPSTGLPFPCKFLEGGRCKIYETRPLHCRLFPERLYINPNPQDFESFSRAGYECIDEGVSLREERAEEMKNLMDEDHRELERTANFFNNEEFIYELTPSQANEVKRIFNTLALDDPERNRRRREALENMIPKKFREEVRDSFTARLKELEKEKSKDKI
jgi:Fe-S-cluster containining protein